MVVCKLPLEGRGDIYTTHSVACSTKVCAHLGNMLFTAAAFLIVEKLEVSTCLLMEAE